MNMNRIDKDLLAALAGFAFVILIALLACALVIKGIDMLFTALIGLI